MHDSGAAPHTNADSNGAGLTQDLNSRPRYRPSEAARWLLVPDSTLRRWLAESVSVDGHAEDMPLIPSVQTDWCRQALSFESLVAIHNLRVLLTEGGSRLRVICYAIQHLSRGR